MNYGNDVEETPEMTGMSRLAMADSKPIAPAPLPEFRVTVPVNLRQSRRYDGVVLVAGRGPAPADIMYISSSVLAEEASDEEKGSFVRIKRTPSYLKGAVGDAVKQLSRLAGVAVEENVYYTALAKWLLPNGKTTNPKLTDCEPGFACLEREIREVKPKIIVTFGKAALEFVTGYRGKFDDIIGVWQWSEQYQCRVMPMRHQYYMLHKPEWTEVFRMDLEQVAQMHRELQGITTKKVPLNYRVIRTAAELRALVDDTLMKHMVYSVDCEWHGHNHVDGLLRSLQIAWAPGHAAYIRFMDDQLNYVFDVSYAEAGAILAPAWNRHAVKLVGHHIAADLPWTSTWLNLDWWGKTRLDTEFAYQACDEHAQLGLERHSLRFSDLGRYEAELDEWKRNNKDKCENGYGYIPDDILIPYALKDVDVPIRAYTMIEDNLKMQGMLDYYRNILNPFCTDAFTQFALTGLCMNAEAADRMRSVYTFAYERQVAKFQRLMRRETEFLLARNFYLFGSPFPEFMELSDRINMVSTVCSDLAGRLVDVENAAQAEALLRQFRPAVYTEALHEQLAPAYKLFDIAHSAAGFNLNSSEHKKLWVFDVKMYTPIKSTSNKAKGVPSMSWDKVMRMKPERRADILPSADKESLQILSDQNSDKLLRRMLALTAIATVRKNLLREPERDPETGAVLEEEGLLAWVCRDGRVHGQLSLTETARPRAWKPNILNWSSRVQDKIKDMIHEAIKEAHEAGELPEKLLPYLNENEILPIRSLVQAPPGMCMVESDYVTAEIYGLAYISGDENLIRILEEPDTQFAVMNTQKGEPVRLRFADDCGIPPENQDPECLMTLWEKGKKVRKVTMDDLKKHPDGSLVHPRVDLHWSLAEMFKATPREHLDPKADRGAGKVGNFSTAYGATPSSVERKIEAETGKKPKPGEGQKIIDALNARQPRSQQFLEDVAMVPAQEGRLRAASGKVRHFVRINDGYRASQRDREAVLNAQGREARNFFMQESVASTAGRAAVWLLDFGRRVGLKGETFVCLYDSLVTLCPMEERMIWKKAHLLYMSLANGWKYHERILRYKVETEFNIGWSLVPPKWQLALFNNSDYLPTPQHYKQAESYLDEMIEFYTKNPEASLSFSGLRPSPAV